MSTNIASVSDKLSIQASSIFHQTRAFELCLTLTMLLLLLYSHDYWYIKIPISAIAIGSFIFPHLKYAKSIWLITLALITIGSINNWYLIDNHKYLLGYWCLAILLSLFTMQPEKSLASSARWLISLVFLFAVIQKTLSLNYLSGDFFYYELLLDERFKGLATYIGGIPEHFYELNYAARRALINYDSSLSSVILQGTPNAIFLGKFITWWNYIIQTVIALLFILPKSNLLYLSRDFWLLLFLFTTYLFAPVIGFGWILAIMGIIQTNKDQNRTRAIYVAAFIFLQLYRIPFSEFFSYMQPSTPG